MKTYKSAACNWQSLYGHHLVTHLKQMDPNCFDLSRHLASCPCDYKPEAGFLKQAI